MIGQKIEGKKMKQEKVETLQAFQKIDLLRDLHS